MMIWTDSNLRAVELHLRELRAQAAQDRLARQARHARPRRPPRRWRRRFGMALIAVGETLAGEALDLTCQPNCAP
jgi:hypothetical protein